MRNFGMAAFAAVSLSASFFTAAAAYADPAPISVTCTSQGQTCDHHGDVPGPFERGWLNITAPASHCSNIIYTVDFVGFSPSPGMPPKVFSSAKSGALGPGGTYRVGVDRRSKSARIYAQGVAGGCNHGRLGGWGATVVFEPYVG